MELGERINLIRKAQGKSLRDVAEKAGLPAAFLSQVERGEKLPRLENVEGIASALGVSAIALQGDFPPAHLSEIEKILRGLGDLDEKQLEAISHLVDTFRSPR